MELQRSELTLSSNLKSSCILPINPSRAIFLKYSISKRYFDTSWLNLRKSSDVYTFNIHTSWWEWPRRYKTFVIESYERINTIILRTSRLRVKTVTVWAWLLFVFVVFVLGERSWLISEHNKKKQKFIITKQNNIDKLVVGKLLKRNFKYMGYWVNEPNKFLWKVD